MCIRNLVPTRSFLSQTIFFFIAKKTKSIRNALLYRRLIKGIVFFDLLTIRIANKHQARTNINECDYFELLKAELPQEDYCNHSIIHQCI